jgi:RNA polymerase sigma-70 factor (ECF subfamily)
VNFSKEELQHFYRYCFTLVRDEHLAHDLLQTCLEKWCRGNHHAHVTHPKAYFMRMIKSQFIDELRKDKGDQEIPYETDELVEIGRDSLEDILIAEEQLQKVLKLMNPEEREMLFLWGLEGYTVQEIADYLELPKGTVLAKLFRLRKRIQNTFSKLNEEGYL